MPPRTERSGDPGRQWSEGSGEKSFVVAPMPDSGTAAGFADPSP